MSYGGGGGYNNTGGGYGGGGGGYPNNNYRQGGGGSSNNSYSGRSAARGPVGKKHMLKLVILGDSGYALLILVFVALVLVSTVLIAAWSASLKYEY
jgi:hypothetical protein